MSSDQVAGIKYAVCGLAKSEKDWSTIRKLRNLITHAVDDRPVLAQKVKDVIGVVHIAFVKSILSLLGSPGKFENHFLRPIIDPSASPKMMAEGTIKKFPAKNIRIDSVVLPHFRGT